MTGNVAQHIPDPDWQRTLDDLRRVAAPDSTLAFESRNPSAHAWEAWAHMEPSTRLTVHGQLREWFEVEEREGGQVLLRSFNHLERKNETVVEEVLLTFRTQTQIQIQLTQAGFKVAGVWGE